MQNQWLMDPIILIREFVWSEWDWDNIKHYVRKIFFKTQLFLLWILSGLFDLKM